MGPKVLQHKLYRVLEPLSNGMKTGDLAWSHRFKKTSIPILVGTGALVLAHGPDLVSLPGWRLREEVFAMLGVTTALGVLTMSDAQIKEAFDHKNTETAKVWKQELLGWFAVPANGSSRRR